MRGFGLISPRVLRVEGLNPASQHLRSLGDGRDVPRGLSGQLSGSPRRGDSYSTEKPESRIMRGRATGSKDSDIALDEALREVQEACLIVDGDDGDPLCAGHLYGFTRLTREVQWSG